MRFITDRKRATGRGSARAGTLHHWYMQMSGIGLALIVPTFLYIFGSTLGSSHDEVLATFSRPVPAIVTGLMIVVGLQHFRKGAQIAIEDYARGASKKLLLVATIALSYGLMATGLFALAKIAL
jgi:succinate dehydrogenase / fumarate reductase, membrane anchor subunit